ncbi:hypothetical protein J8273_7473 [Carpediemonas membranifera]|uniref:Uncharacterized protein n=1 Tax=Carpediemonas membranifera TaxID=201153 RepID=A0A8J6B204_9EUKA|nr:hypothetical protein J8273_7473 [Carpediemonas membranifera]|eukprot:KAG9391199.1 hypothetical protein J8273_7473 [Carpediemonas membranifera]
MRLFSITRSRWPHSAYLALTYIIYTAAYRTQSLQSAMHSTASTGRRSSWRCMYMLLIEQRSFVQTAATAATALAVAVAAGTTAATSAINISASLRVVGIGNRRILGAHSCMR